MPKLTNSQLSVLQELAKADGRTSFSPRYKPISALHDLSFADRNDGKFGSASYSITDAGRRYLSERAQRILARGLPESEINLLQHLAAEISDPKGAETLGAMTLAIIALWEEDSQSLERSGLIYIRDHGVELTPEATEFLAGMAVA